MNTLTKIAKSRKSHLSQKRHLRKRRMRNLQQRRLQRKSLKFSLLLKRLRKPRRTRDRLLLWKLKSLLKGKRAEKSRSTRSKSGTMTVSMRMSHCTRGNTRRNILALSGIVNPLTRSPSPPRLLAKSRRKIRRERNTRRTSMATLTPASSSCTRRPRTGMTRTHMRPHPAVIMPTMAPSMKSQDSTCTRTK